MYGLTDGVSMIIRQTILQPKTQTSLGKSRLSNHFLLISNELGVFARSHKIDVMPAVVFGGVMTILTVGFTSIKFPNFRKLDLTKDMNEN